METLDQILGVYTLDRGWVHLAVALGLLIVAGAVALAVVAIRRSRGLYSDGWSAARDTARMDFTTWRDGYVAAPHADDEPPHIGLIDTIGLDVLGVPARPDLRYPPPPSPYSKVIRRPLNFGD